MDSGLNAVVDPWVLCADSAGQARELSLRQTYEQAGQWVTLAGDPPVVAAVLRLLVAVVLDATGGPRDNEEWATWWSGGLPLERIMSYLDRNAAAMSLFGPRALFQDSGLPERVGAKSVAEMCPHMATGQNPVLYGAQTTDLAGPRPASFSQAEALRWLVSAQQYSRPGMWANAEGSGPAAGRPSLLLDRLLAVPTGPSLHHTLMLNLPTGDQGGVPPWRSAAAVHDRSARDLVELLTWQTRHVRLLPGSSGQVSELLIAVDPRIDPAVGREVIAAWDPHISCVANPRFDPSKPDSPRWLLVSYDPAVASWRSAAALSSATGGARMVRALRERTEAIGDTPVRVEAIGLACENRAKYVSWVRTSAPVSARGATALERAVQTAEVLGSALGSALVIVRKRVGQLPERPSIDQARQVRDAVARAFWPSLDVAGSELAVMLREAADDQAREALLDGWVSKVAHAAHQALDARTSTLRAHPRNADAVAAGHRVVSAATRDLVETA